MARPLVVETTRLYHEGVARAIAGVGAWAAKGVGMTAWRDGLSAILADLARRQICWTYRELAGQLAVPGPRSIRQVTEGLDDSLRADHAAGRPLAAAVIISARRGGVPGPGFFHTCREIGLYFGPDGGPQAAFFHDLELRRVYAAAAAKK